MENPSEKETFSKLRNRLIRMNIMIAISVFAIEVVISVLFYFQDNIDQSLPEYITRFLIIPTVLNSLAIGSELFVRKKFPDNDKLQNSMVISTLLIICTVVASTHYVFENTLTIFCFPIFSSVIFCDKILTRKTACFSILGLIITMASRFSSRYPTIDKLIIADFFVASAIILLALFVSNLIIILISEQKKQLISLADEAKKAQKEALAANEAKSAFLANMSHEIRTPINGILGMDSMILRECTIPEIQEYAINIQSAGKNLLSIINDVLDFSKIESGKLDIIRSPYELFSLLNDCYNMVIQRAQENNLEFRIENDPEMPACLVGDEIRIKQIIINLLTNAIKYTKKGSVVMRVDGKIGEDGDYILIVSVKDTGEGISEQNLKNIFKSFKRIDERKNHAIEGTGLGLTITKQLIDLMKGKIKVTSECGKGSEFTIEIPQKVRGVEKLGNFYDKYKKTDAVEVYREKFRAPNARILVVDDVPMNLKVFKGLLKGTCINIDTAESGAKCLELVEKNRYDMIFLDHMMPEMDGIETFKRIKQNKNSPNGNTPVIMLTANAMSSAREEYFKIGFTDYLSKPIHNAGLENIILRYLSPDIVETEFDSEEPVSKEENSTEQQNGVMDKLGKVLDTASGLSYCVSDENFYIDIIKDYIAANRTELIKTAYEANDLENYRINVHALKSTSLAIGANSVSEKAKQLEEAAKISDVEYLKQNTDIFLTEYGNLLDELKKILDIE